MLSSLADVLGWPFRAWRRAREPQVSEWLLSLDGQDLAVLSDPVYEDMFWDWYRVTPLHPKFVPRVLDAEAWNRVRFQVRHRQSGLEVSTFSAGGGPPRREGHVLRVLLRSFTPLDGPARRRP